MNHERLATILRCPACGRPMRYRPRVYSYCCDGQVLHAYRVKDQIADFVTGDGDKRQNRVNRAFDRIAGRRYEMNVTGASGFDRFMNQAMWGTTKFIPLLFELLDSVASDCDPGFFLDIPVGTGVFTAGEYSLQPNLEFIAADYSREMLESALEKVRVEDFGNVMLVRADARSLPFVDGAFSGVLTMNGIDAFPDQEKALDELVRMLKPNGKLAGSTYVRGERWLTDLIMGRFAASLGYVTRPVYTEDEFLAAMEARGMTNVVTKKIKSIMFFSGRLNADSAPEEKHEEAPESPNEKEGEL
ncbi:MAG: class I SAM-dependent methyltransferase [Candidatus Geothermincolia bacterium]